MDPERFPSLDLGIAAGRKENFDKLCDCSRLAAVHFPYLSAVQVGLNSDYESQTSPPEGGPAIRNGQSFRTCGQRASFKRGKTGRGFGHANIGAATLLSSAMAQEGFKEPSNLPHVLGLLLLPAESDDGSHRHQ
jgi:hypothetical protein